MNAEGSVIVEETYVTERGRKRLRRVAVDLAAVRARLRAAGTADRAAWEQVRALLLRAVGESTFEIWLELLELIAVDRDAVLIVSAPAETTAWVRERFGRVIDGAAERAGRRLRIAGEAERKAADALMPVTSSSQSGAPVVSSTGVGSGGDASSEAKPRVGLVDVSESECGHRSGDPPADQSGGRPAYARAGGSAYPLSYSAVYNQQKEMS